MPNHTNAMNCFDQTKPCVCAHVYALRYKKEEYLQQLRRTLRNPAAWANVSHATKGRVLAALHLTSEHKEVDSLFPYLEITDIEKALCNILDRAREARQLKSKIEKLERDNPHIMQVEVESIDGLDGQDANRAADAMGDSDDVGELQVSIRRQRCLRKMTRLRRTLKELEASLEFGETGGIYHKSLPCSEAHKDSAVLELIQSGSVSGSLSRKVRKWAMALKPDFLEYVMLEFPKKPWQNVADLVHFNPKSDFAVPYFLDDVYGQPIPEDSFVFCMRKLSNASPADIVSVFRATAQNFPQIYNAYAFLRTKPTLMHNKETVEDLARNIPLHLAIWNFEELHAVSRECSKIVQQRLQNDGVMSKIIDTNDSKVYTYGKLIERIQTFHKMGMDSLAKALTQLAKRRLDYMKEMLTVLGTRVAVFGDASSSMQTAIDAATIFAAMVSACLNAELSFFSHRLVESPYKKPSTVEQTMEVCKKIRANGCTSLAAALWPYFHHGLYLDTIVMVTDEEENTSWEGYSFAELLKAYKEKVNPNVALIVVCVGTGDKRFRQALQGNGIEWKTVTIDRCRPDLTKFDALLEQVAAMSTVASSPEMIEREADIQDVNSADGDEEFVMIE